MFVSIFLPNDSMYKFQDRLNNALSGPSKVSDTWWMISICKMKEGRKKEEWVLN